MRGAVVAIFRVAAPVRLHAARFHVQLREPADREDLVLQDVERLVKAHVREVKVHLRRCQFQWVHKGADEHARNLEPVQWHAAHMPKGLRGAGTRLEAHAELWEGSKKRRGHTTETHRGGVSGARPGIGGVVAGDRVRLQVVVHLAAVGEELQVAGELAKLAVPLGEDLMLALWVGAGWASRLPVGVGHARGEAAERVSNCGSDWRQNVTCSGGSQEGEAGVDITECCRVCTPELSWRRRRRNGAVCDRLLDARIIRVPFERIAAKSRAQTNSVWNVSYHRPRIERPGRCLQGAILIVFHLQTRDEVGLGRSQCVWDLGNVSGQSLCDVADERVHRSGQDAGIEEAA
mmetsp:Transcript_29810/g.77133  ORF Transcript_29810/g.77133 Transcript_29810/m.77133 type:complete len:347 (+) Transcript_29810:1469-2509(+)